MRAGLILLAAVFSSDACASDASRALQVDWLKLPAVAGWSNRVVLAQAEADAEARQERFAALARDALRGTDMELHVAGTGSPAEIDPGDYAPLPAINFDMDLNRKRSHPSAPGAATRLLENNAGYYFTHQGSRFVVMGPIAFATDGPDYFRMYVDHELFHARSPTDGESSPADREIEAWVYQFRQWFYKTASNRRPWLPLIRNYEIASLDARRLALAALLDYYRNPPADIVGARKVADARRRMRDWIRQRQSDTRTKSSALIEELAGSTRGGRLAR